MNFFFWNAWNAGNAGDADPLPVLQGDAIDGQPPDGQPPNGQPLDGQPLDGQPPDEQHVREGLYIITNKKARSALDLAGGNDWPGTSVLGFEQHIEWDNSNQLWSIKRDGANGTYTLRNLFGGTCLDLEGGLRHDGSRVAGWPRGHGRANQEWYIEKREPHYYAIRCHESGTFLEIPGGNPSNCVDATCSRASGQADHQRWALELASRNGAEIRTLFKSWKPNLLPQIFQLFGESTQYFILRNNVRKRIWEDTKLRTQPVRSHLFDYDAFVIGMKDAAANWAQNHFKADMDGYSILFGIIYGKARNGLKAYNWYLSPDMGSLLFFDPQSGKEYGLTALDGFGFEPTFAMF